MEINGQLHVKDKHAPAPEACRRTHFKLYILKFFEF